MIDLNENKVEDNDKTNTNEKDNADTTGRKNVEMEPEKQIKIIEINDNDKWNEVDNTTNLTKIPKETVIDIGIIETSLLPQNIETKKQRLWLLNQTSIFAKRSWRQGHRRSQRQDGQQPFQQDVWTQFSQGRGYGGFGGNEGYTEGAPLDYDPESRNSFIRLVMLIVLVMLALTIGYIIFVLATPEVKKFFRKAGAIVALPASLILLGISYAMSCSPCTRRPPCNFVVLFITMCCMSVIAAYVSCRFRTQIVLYAAVATAAIVMVCLALACTSFDFTSWILFVVVISTGLAVVGIIVLLGMAISGFYLKPLHIAILIAFVVLQSVTLVIELQMILGGKSVELGEDDYALAAFMLYTSIANIFIHMVQILGLLDN